MRSVLLRAVPACCLLLTSWAFAGQAATSSLTLRGAIDQARMNQPSLAVFAYDLEIQDAHVAEARLSPGMQGELLVEDGLGTGDRRGLTAAQTTLSLSHVFELGSKREGRVGLAEATRHHLRTAQAAQELDLLAEVARRFLVVLNWQSRGEIAAEGVRHAERTLEAVNQRIAAARAPQAEAIRAQVDLVEAELDVEEAEHELETARRFLAAAMGERDPSFGPAAGALLELPRLATFPELLARLERSPDFLQFAAEARRRDAELRLAETRRRPDLRATVGVRRYEQGDDVALVGGITIPLASSARAQSRIDVARAQRGRLDNERSAAFLQAQAQLFDQYQALEHARHEFDLVRNEIIPRLEQALVQIEYAYRQGRYSYLEWTSAQRALIDARRRLVDVATHFHTFRTEIERLTGESLDLPGVTP